MEEYRTIIEKSKEYEGIVATRTRTSQGLAFISLRFDGMHLNFSNADGNDAYEHQALEASKVLAKVALNACLLPEST